jgi:hypothetical protein
MKTSTFTELFLTQPPTDISRLSPRFDLHPRLWSGYDSRDRSLFEIYCPYRTGNLIPHLVTDVQPIKEDGLWYWLVSLELREILSCPNCGNIWDALLGCSPCSFSPDDLF